MRYNETSITPRRNALGRQFSMKKQEEVNTRMFTSSCFYIQKGCRHAFYRGEIDVRCVAFSLSFSPGDFPSKTPSKGSKSSSECISSTCNRCFVASRFRSPSNLATSPPKPFPKHIPKPFQKPIHAIQNLYPASKP